VGAMKLNLFHQILKAEIIPGMKASKLQVKGNPVAVVCFQMELFIQRPDAVRTGKIQVDRTSDCGAFEAF
jgi:hypothetical protein